MKAARSLFLVILVMALAMVTGLGGCDSGTTPPPSDGGQDGQLDGADGQDGQDGADGEDGADGQDGADGGPTAAGPTRFAPSAGSGTVESEGHKARLHVGAPQPMGSASGPDGAVRVGP